MIYLFAIVILIVFSAVPVEAQMAYGVSFDYLTNCFLYMFFHVSWLHLLINIFSIVLLWQGVWRLWERQFSGRYWIPSQRFLMRVRLFLYIYGGAVLAGLCCAQEIPTVGCSGMVFFMLGMLLLLNPTSRQLRSFIWIAAAVAIQLFFGKSNVALHIVAFIFGAMLVVLKRLLMTRQHDDV